MSFTPMRNGLICTDTAPCSDEGLMLNTETCKLWSCLSIHLYVPDCWLWQLALAWAYLASGHDCWHPLARIWLQGKAAGTLTQQIVAAGCNLLAAAHDAETCSLYSACRNLPAQCRLQVMAAGNVEEVEPARGAASAERAVSRNRTAFKNRSGYRGVRQVGQLHWAAVSPLQPSASSC